jgi:hypothetical protein
VRLLMRGGAQLKEVLPGEPCDIIGWKEPPEAGMMILEVESEVCRRSVAAVWPCWRIADGASAWLVHIARS